MADKRITFKWLGRTLGTGTGWDGEIGQCWYVYDFQPAESFKIEACPCFVIDEEHGTFTREDNDGNTLGESLDCAAVLTAVPKD